MVAEDQSNTVQQYPGYPLERVFCGVQCETCWHFLDTSGDVACQ